MALQSGTYDWRPIVTAPFDGDLELAVVDCDSIGLSLLAFVGAGWRQSALRLSRHTGDSGKNLKPRRRLLMVSRR